MNTKKFMFDRYTATTIIFITCIAFFFAANFINSPEKITDKIKTQKDSTVKSYIGSIEYGYNEGFFAKMNFIDLYGLAQRALNKNIIGDFDVIRDQQGSLHLGIESEPLTKFNPKLIQDIQAASGDIPLVYLHTGNKIIDNYTSFAPGLISYKLANSDFIIDRVLDFNVTVMDLRQWMKEDNLNPELAFYKTDHHWRVETAFYTFQNLILQFEDKLSLTFPKRDVILDQNQYDFIKFEDYFLGSSGKRVGRWYSGMDDFTLILPKYHTNYTAYDYNRFASSIDGSFYDCLISEERLYDDAIDTNRYTSYLYGDYGQRKFINHEGTNNILIIQDSYGLPLSSFLSLGFHETTIIDFRLFNGVIADVIQDGNFDVILFVNQIQYP